MSGDSTQIYVSAKPMSYIPTSDGFKINTPEIGAGIDIGINNTNLNIESNVGKTFAKGKATVGYSLPLNKNISLGLNGNGYGAKEFSTNNNTFKAGVGADIMYNKGNFSIGAGVEAGYVSSTPIKRSTSTNGINVSMTQQLKGLYVTPNVKAEYKFNDKLALVGNVNLYEGGIGIAYNINRN